MEKHNHKPNFGRYFAECPRCVEQYPDGPPPPKVRPPKATEDPAMKQLVEIMLRQEAAKIAEVENAKAVREAVRMQMRAGVENEKAQKRAHQDNCSHQMPNKNSAINQGQIFNDGYYHPMCHICFKTFPKRRPSHEEQPTAIEV